MDLPFTLVAEDKAKVGLIVLQSDESIETDLHRMKPAGVNLMVSRVASSVKVSSDTLAQMASHLTASAQLFPAGTAFRAVGYGCTSGTAQIGINKIAKLVQAGADTPIVTEPVSALIEACRALNVSRIGLISPYVAEVSDRLQMVLSSAGITVTDFASFNEPTEANVVRIAPSDIAVAAINMARSSDCDAIFLSCTNLRTLDVIDEIETATGKPVLSSNQVLGWHLYGIANVGPATFTPGMLWDRNKGL